MADLKIIDGKAKVSTWNVAERLKRLRYKHLHDYGVDLHHVAVGPREFLSLIEEMERMASYDKSLGQEPNYFSLESNRPPIYVGMQIYVKSTPGIDILVCPQNAIWYAKAVVTEEDLDNQLKSGKGDDDGRFNQDD